MILFKNPNKEQQTIINSVKSKIVDRASEVSLMLFDCYLNADIKYLNDKIVINTFKLDNKSKKESIKELKKNFELMSVCIDDIPVYVATSWNPYFLLTEADAVTVPFMMYRPIIVRESCLYNCMSDLVPLIAHELTHSILYTKDYMLTKLPIKDAYAYEQVFRYFKN